MGNVKNIDLMHQLFGAYDEQQCKNCSNFIRLPCGKRTRGKCSVYGITHSEASDWVGEYPACGMFNRDHDGESVMRAVTHEKPTEEPLDGQTTLF